MSETKSIALKRDITRLHKTRKLRKTYVESAFNQNHSMLDAARATAPKNNPVLGVDPVIIGNLIQSVKNQLQQQNKKAPAWRYISAANAAFMYHYAIKKMETEQLRSIPFTFNITPGLLEKAISSKKPLHSYLLKRLRESLQRELNREVDFYFVIEVSGASQNETPHLHGEILLTSHEIDLTNTNLRHPDKRPIHRAFHAINDYSDNSLKNTAFMLKQAPTDAGWPVYLTKHISITTMYTGHPVAETQRINRTAREIYREHFNPAGLKNLSK